jgi:hypothetical protein
VDDAHALAGEGFRLELHFHCPYCHGFEVSGRRLAVLGAGPDRVRLALQLTRFTDDLVVCTDGEPLPRDLAELLAAAGVPVRGEPVTRRRGCASAPTLPAGWAARSCRTAASRWTSWPGPACPGSTRPATWPTASACPGRSPR